MRPLAALAALALAACPAAAPPAPDAGPPPVVDAGCGLACEPPPDGGECEPTGAPCGASGDCCLGLACDAGSCGLPSSPCPPGEQPLSSGCGCDPSLSPGAAGGCPAGDYCGMDLACHPLSGGGPSYAATPAPVGAPCDPAATDPDGGPLAPCLVPDGGAPVDRLPDPSGQSLYLCEQSCQTSADCPLPWQLCPADGGHCEDDRCTSVPATPAEAQSLFELCRPVDGGYGLCLPFSAELQGLSGGTTPETFGLCVAAGSGGLGAACAEPPRRGAPDAGLCDDGHVCWAGLCRTPCDASLSGDAGSDAGCGALARCEPLLLEPLVPGASPVAGGCVASCELDGGCAAGPADGGADAGMAVDGGLGGDT
ncbi:MAG: hypothetical protein ACYCWW_15540 [Deltaproteobacteria bacterium]